MIESAPLESLQPQDEPESAQTRPDPVVLEDLVAVLRFPALCKKLDQVLEKIAEGAPLPDDFPLRPHEPGTTERLVEYRRYWRDEHSLLQLFVGMAWGESGHDPLWELRVEALPALDPGPLRSGGLHRLAARRAESRFSEWDAFWHEDKTRERYLIGASAACTRFLEEEDPDAVAAEYLSGALHAVQASGALLALLEAARHSSGLA